MMGIVGTVGSKAALPARAHTHKPYNEPTVPTVPKTPPDGRLETPDARPADLTEPDGRELGTQTRNVEEPAPIWHRRTWRRGRATYP